MSISSDKKKPFYIGLPAKSFEPKLKFISSNRHEIVLTEKDNRDVIYSRMPGETLVEMIKRGKNHAQRKYGYESIQKGNVAIEIHSHVVFTQLAAA